MADSFRALAISQLAMQANSLLPGEILLLELELSCQIQKSELFLFFRNHLVEKSQVIPKEQNRRRIVDLRILADVVLKENGGHGCHVLMAEAQVRARETGV